jgi:C1A family cysteine protease
MELEKFKEAEKKAKKKTCLFLILGLSIWMVFLFFFLNQSRFEQSLVFAKILPTGLVVKPIIIIDDTSKIDPNVDPNIFIVDTTNIDTTIKKGSSYSLRPFAPNVMSQGQLGSCVSWASAYAGLTIVKRIEKNNKNLEPFSPLNLYVRYKKHFNEDPCSYGACVPFALNILKSNGCSAFNNFLPNECSKNVSENMVYDDKLYSFDPLNSSSISSIKSAIAGNMPVVIGIKCYDGDDWKNAIFNNGVWSGYFTGNPNSGHAMCLVGYDDNKAGGAFEIMNSWGEDWGDKGYFWIKYADFVKHVDESYALIPQKAK